MGQLADLNDLPALATGDLILVRDISDASDKDKKMQLGKVAWKDSGAIVANRLASWKDANTVQDAGFLTTDVALKNAANSFVGNQSITGSLSTSAGLSAASSIGTPLSVSRSGSATTGAQVLCSLTYNTSGAPANTLGPTINFGLNGGTFYTLGAISVQRSGGDANGEMVFSTANGAVLTERMRLGTLGEFIVPYVWNVVATGTAVHINANGILTKATSSRRYKENIKDLGADYGDRFVAALRPVLYNPTNGDDRSNKIGLIAEEVQAIGGGLGEPFISRNNQGQVESLHYDRLVAPLIGSVQRLLARVETLENKLSAWEGA